MVLVPYALINLLALDLFEKRKHLLRKCPHRIDFGHCLINFEMQGQLTVRGASPVLDTGL